MYWPSPEESEVPHNVGSFIHAERYNSNRRSVCDYLSSLLDATDSNLVPAFSHADLQLSTPALTPEVVRDHETCQPRLEVNDLDKPRTSHGNKNTIDDDMARFVIDFHQYSLNDPE